MKRPLTILERRFPSSVADSIAVDLEANERDVFSKIDRRNVIQHTFSSTSLEAIDHKLGRKPVVAPVVYQSAAANISGDINQWTNRKIYMRSSVSGITAKFLLS